MSKKKILLSVSSGFLLLGTAFAAIFGTAKLQEFKQSISTASSIEAELRMYQEKYLIEDISKKDEITSKAINEVGNYVKKLYKEDKIESYSIYEDSIVFNNKCGVVMSFSPAIKDTYGDLKDVQNKIRIIPNQVIYTEASHVTDGRQPLPSGMTDDGELIPNAAEDIADEFDNVTFDQDDLLQDVPLDKEFMQKLGPNQFVMILGHGTYVEGYHSTLNTGRQFSWDDFGSDPTYREDCRNGLIVDTSGGEAFTTRYVDKYVGDLTNTFIYFGECELAKDSAMPNAFLYKGAEALVANTLTITMRYGDIMQYTTCEYLAKKYPETDRYYTLEEALGKAKELYGDHDPDGLGSVPTIFGNPNYSLDKTFHAPLFKNDYTYTGEPITFVTPGIGYHIKDGDPVTGTDCNYYAYTIELDEGYKWPTGSVEEGKETSPIEVTSVIHPKQTTFEDMVQPTPLTDISTDGRNVELFKKGESAVGTFEYFLEGSEEFYWSDKIPTVNKPGTYNIAWRFVGDDNHTDLGGNNGFKSTVVVKAAPSYTTFPAWAIVLLCVIGAGLVVTLTILTGKKVKKLSQDK